MRLLCDEMLGKLARWLRLLGHDAAYLQGLEDAALLALALAEDRLLLTRDAGLAARAPAGRVFLVKALEPEDQLREVVRGLDLGPAEPLSRCSVCNVPLRQAGVEEARDRVPPAVLATHAQYWACPACARLYWKGTHVERIEAMARALEGERGA
jgi:hypothetical protein